jgi:hypothetical protein
MTQPYGRQPDPGEPTTRFGDPYRADQQYGQQPYGQPYPPQGRYSAAANAYGAPIGSGARFGVVGATLAGVGAVLLVIAFTAVDWFKNPSSGFRDIGDTLDAHSALAPGLADAYFSWLGWLLLVAVVAVAIAANLPTPASGPLRAFGAILAAAAMALTFFAIRLDSSGVPFTTYLKNARVGFYLALVGFLVVGIGALIGPKRD